MSDLRTRIAAAIKEAHSELNFSLEESWDNKCLRLADAVIRGLVLEVEDGECSHCHAMLPGCRYVTEYGSK